MQLAQKYFENVKKEFLSGRAREHSYRPALKEILENLNSNILATNEPKREKCGAPDFIITDKKNIPRGYIEAKDIIPNILDDKKNQEQIKKYFDGELGYNFIYTDYIEFRFYRNSKLVKSLKIAEISGKNISSISENFTELEELLKNFLAYKTQTINSSKKLSEIMAGKARMIKRAIYMTLKNNKDGKTEIHSQYEIFKKILVHDLTEEGFADIYAQTITYGLFTARLHDPTLATFDRDEAARLLPVSNPFLKKFFQNLRDNLDSRIEWIVDDLIEIFLASDVRKLLDGYGKTSARNDPIIHFYEDFLANYDKKLRKSRGVYYTPEPVVNFIIKSVDFLLKKYFNLKDGLADTSKIEKKIEVQGKMQKKEFHKVQILDPATGTGTFLDSTIKYIFENNFSFMKGAWASYVENHLIPRLNGFEIMMTSYAMAHLKLDLTLKETGYENNSGKRLGVYLTNSLEEEHNDVGTLFSSWLSAESQEASEIKKNLPIMTIIGNPPYSGISSNKGDFILNLLEDYKKEPETKEKLNERKHWLNDDYVKFLRFGQYFIEKNGEGILAFINPHGFLDNPTFRGMRYSLLETYDQIFILDLHGNTKKKEVCPDGSADQNVFDIQQGVSINFFVKTGKKKKKALAEVFHFDLFGKRQEKYDFLNENDFENINFTKIENVGPNYFFVPKDFGVFKEYDKFISVKDIFDVNSTGIVTANDSLTIYDTKEELIKNTEKILNSSNPYTEFNIKDTRRATKEQRLQDLKESKERGIIKISYRPFDDKFMYRFLKNEYWINSPRDETMKNFILGENLGLVTARSNKSSIMDHFYISKNVTEAKLGERTTQSSLFPLYLYKENKNLDFENSESLEKIPNLNFETIEKIEKKLKLKFQKDFSPENLLDYIYGFLHSKNYREKYKEFLKIDFPKIDFDINSNRFFKIAKIGEKLRKLHLLENISNSSLNSNFNILGTNKIEKVFFENEKIFINEEQFFGNVPFEAWEFFIGGYQPLQKWLKDRKEKALTNDEILHFLKMIFVITETINLMKNLENLEK